MLTGLTQRLDAWIFGAHPVSLETLARLRIIYALSVMFLVGPTFLWVSYFPDSFYHPPLGPMALLAGFPSRTFLLCHGLLLSTALVALLVGWRTPAASLLVGVLLIVGQGAVVALGKERHSRVFMELLPLCFAGSGWGGRYSLDARRRGEEPPPQPWALTLWAVLVAYGMATAAYPKMRHGWLDPTSPKVRLYMEAFISCDRAGPLAPLASTIDRLAAWKAFDYLTLALEGGFAIGALRLGWIRLFAATACLFHFGVYLLLGIAFSTVLIGYLPFVAWDAVPLPRPRPALVAVWDRLAPRVRGWHLAVGGALHYAMLHYAGGPMRWLPRRSMIFVNSGRFALYAGGVVGLAYLVSRAARAARALTRR